MIASDTSVKMKKSPKKPLVQIPVAEESEVSSSEDLGDSDAEEAGIDSPNEENNKRKSISEEENSSSGAEGDESSATENNDNDKSLANPGWADAMKKILSTKKPKKKKSIVLSKAKKLNDVVPKTKDILPFEIADVDGKIKDILKIEKEIINKDEKITKRSKQKRKQSLGIRTKPSALDREREKRLQKIATNGVVQLFNAVRQQQKEIEQKLVDAGPLERKREKALKNIDRKAFLDVLMGGTNKLTVENNFNDSKETENGNIDNNNQEDKVWNILRDDFVMGAKLQDWNKQNSDDESSVPEEMDSD